MKRIVSLLLLGSLFVAACGDDTPDSADLPPDASVSDPLPTDDPASGILPTGMGPGVSVADALTYDGSEPLLLNGFVFVYADGSVVIADAIAESFPPQPAGAQMAVKGLDLMQIPLTEGPSDSEIEIVQWTDSLVQLVGEVVGGVFVGNSVASA